eukprot:5285830-Pyramimonas_sp.AAC.1
MRPRGRLRHRGGRRRNGGHQGNTGYHLFYTGAGVPSSLRVMKTYHRRRCAEPPCDENVTPAQVYRASV